MQIDGREAFLAILATVLRHARFAFRHIRCEHEREDRVAEALALAFCWTLRLSERGKDVRAFPTAIAAFATRAVKSGRTLCSARRPRDPLSRIAQADGGFVTAGLPEFSTLAGNPLEEALTDNTQTPPDEQAAFRIDFLAWRQTHGERNRAILDEMAAGEGTNELAQRHHLSPARISQLRREFRAGWLCFIGEPA